LAPAAALIWLQVGWLVDWLVCACGGIGLVGLGWLAGWFVPAAALAWLVGLLAGWLAPAAAFGSGWLFDACCGVELDCMLPRTVALGWQCRWLFAPPVWSSAGCAAAGRIATPTNVMLGWLCH